MEQVVLWKALLAVIGPVYPKAGNGRRPYALKSMLRIHLVQNWFGYSDPAMEQVLYEVVPLRCFAGLLLARGSVTDAMPEGELKDAVKHSEHMKAAVRSKVEHPFRVVKRQFGLQKVRFMGLVKNMA